MTIAEEHASGLKEVEGDLPQTITYAGQPYPCIAGSKTKGGTLDIGGEIVSFDFSCTIRRELFTTLPKHGQSFTNGSDSFKVLHTIESGTGSHFRLFGVSPNRGG